MRKAKKTRRIKIYNKPDGKNDRVFSSAEEYTCLLEMELRDEIDEADDAWIRVKREYPDIENCRDLERPGTMMWSLYWA